MRESSTHDAYAKGIAVTNAQRVLDAIKQHPGLTDAEVRNETGIQPHQRVNQICRRLESGGLLIRRRGTDGLIHNFATPIQRPAEDVYPSNRTPAARPTLTATSEAVDLIPERTNTVIVLPCSARKQEGGTAVTNGPSILEILPSALADRLRAARREVARAARLDESRLLPAIGRYRGTLYAAAEEFRSSVSQSSPVVIISGGYGLVTSDERIGMYNRQFHVTDWPRDLLEDCLLEYVEACGAQNMISFCSRTTHYSRLLRHTPWRSRSINALLASPDPLHQGGAQVLVPRAAGQALTAFLAGRLDRTWRSTDGLALSLETLA